MDEEVNPAILDKLTKVCLCKGISRASMKKAISGGATTLEAVQKATGAGSGSCCGRRCGPKIEELLQQR
ncbi:(2Fe-2S)-binding protein [Azotosporobacter soli]|uniref:(2Fe-2S)-binding protein n=1 Tax=Azotosporobacter soli TaxID=3055040 RepID=UPI0031FEA002